MPRKTAITFVKFPHLSYLWQRILPSSPQELWSLILHICLGLAFGIWTPHHLQASLGFGLWAERRGHTGPRLELVVLSHCFSYVREAFPEKNTISLEHCPCMQEGGGCVCKLSCFFLGRLPLPNCVQFWSWFVTFVTKIGIMPWGIKLTSKWCF